ncbi:unnamed protein product [Lactuca saligna]|uniref:Uncharacterized protein n=1 Tax=Lactuca saligna TaxID=75948 RepID=A0AA36E4Q6_LACSI|nr:unnamed protein product [Lactuca saligna]
MKSQKILNPAFFSYIRINLFCNISSPSSPPVTHLHYLQTTPTLQAYTTLTVPPLPYPTASTKTPQVYKPKLVAIGIELAAVWEAICQAHVTGQCVTIQMLGRLAALRELVKTNLSHYLFTEFRPQELKKNSLMQHHNEASNDSDLVEMDDHYSDEFFDFDDESECDYIITLPEDQTVECTLLKTVGADWLKCDKHEDHLAICPGSIVHKYAADGIPEFFIVINFQEQMQMMSMDQMAGANIPSLAAMEQTRMLAHTLAQNTNPKFQNCKFLQFVSKMSHGELTIEDNQVRPAGGDWANEYQHQYNAGPSSTSWADQYACEEASKTFTLLFLSTSIQ